MIQATNAQDTIRVVPNYSRGGELNAAIAANGPNKVYLLEADGYYTLSATLELVRTTGNQTAKYQIVGEKPKAGQYMPVLQTSNTANGVPFESMFRIGADVVLKDFFIANQTTQGQIGKFAIRLTGNVRFIMDGCVVDPVGTTDLINGGVFSEGSRIYLTNNKILRQGDPFSPGGGHLLRDVLADTLYIENNSIISTDNTLFSSSATETRIKNLWFNHNTVAFHDVSIKSTNYLSSEFIVNNLFYDLTTYAQLYTWSSIDPDFGHSQLVRSLANTDTLEVAGIIETLPSNRTSYWNRNGHYVSQGLRDNLLTIPNKETNQPHLYVFPILWNNDMPSYYASNFNDVMPTFQKACRENAMFNSSSFPNFIQANTFYDINPEFVDSRIESFAATNAKSAAYWFRQTGVLKLKENLPATQESAFWDVDGWAGTTAAFYPTVWPRWNGKYTNSILLSASIEGLPLGDLNYFPEAKTLWEKNRNRIANYIKTLNTDKIDITGLKPKKLDNLIRISPNPMTDYIRIETVNPINKVIIYSITGNLLKEVNVLGAKIDIPVSFLNKGIYLIEVKFVSGQRFTTNLMK